MVKVAPGNTGGNERQSHVRYCPFFSNLISLNGEDVPLVIDTRYH